MTLPVSGPISLSAIAAEHGGVPPHSLGEYTRGNANNLVHSSNTSIPAEGPIALSDFLSTSRFGHYTLNSQLANTVDGDQFGFNAFELQGSLDPNARYRGYDVAWVLWNEYDNVAGIALLGTGIPESTITSFTHPDLGTITDLTYVPDFSGIVTVWTFTTPTAMFPVGTSTEITIL